MSSYYINANQLHNLRLPEAMGTARVDREAKTIFGYIVAELGPFKTPGRGEFDAKSLSQVRRLMKSNPQGAMVRYDHPSFDSGMGTVLGRAKNARLDGDKVRADLHFDETAFRTPQGDLANYVMDLAESDNGLISSSLSLRADFEYRLDRGGRIAVDEQGEMLPPLWRPTVIVASDIVTVGDAVHSGFLSSENATGIAPTIRVIGDEPAPPTGSDPAIWEYELALRERGLYIR